MITQLSFKRLALFSLALVSSLQLAHGQAVSAASPRQEKLLNGLRVLMWSQPSASRFEVKLRVHAGASFDQQAKEGTMCLLAEALFPTDESREIFTDDFGGSLQITCNYDYIEIQATSKPESYLALLETIAGAVSNPVLDRQTTDAAKARVVTRLTADEKSAKYAADIAARRRLFGTFPYGRPEYGSIASIKTLDFADLRFGYDRLFGADNATLALSGNFPPDIAYRAIRRYFGSWLKSDRKVPSTFRQPDPPIAATQILDSPESGITEIRYALRGVARNDRDYAAASVLAKVLEQRARNRSGEGQRNNVWVTNHSNILPGAIVVGFSNFQREITAAVTGERPKSANDIIADALSERITDAEFAAAKSAVLADLNKLDVATRWLDVDTYKLQSVKADQAAFDSLTAADVQNLADRVKLLPVASVLLLPQKASD
jgi:zinc protease